MNGKIALVDRGVCSFNIKAQNVHAARAIGVIVVDNIAGTPSSSLGGTDPTILIPAVRITLADGNAPKAALATRLGTHSGMFANLGLIATVRQGADAFHGVSMYAPNLFQAVSSDSHGDTAATPDLLMEPVNGDLTTPLCRHKT